MLIQSNKRPLQRFRDRQLYLNKVSLFHGDNGLDKRVRRNSFKRIARKT